jgi:hypothetical protein
MALSTFQGPVRSLSGFISQGPNTIAAVSTAAVTLDVNNYAGKIIPITLATTTITLPALNASANPASSGPGQDPNTLNNLGTTYTFIITTASSAVKVITAASNFLLGGTSMSTADAAANNYIANGTTIRSINLNGTTTGGIAGSFFTITAITSTQWLIQGELIGSSTLATPFATS